MTSTVRPTTAGHFELQIDGHVTSAYLKSVDGGHVNSAVVDEPIGPENERIKHLSVAAIDPITIDCGISGAKDILKWIQDSWRKEHSRRSGQITHADFNLYETFKHQFYDALITETSFPTLDGGSKEAGYLKVKFQPERVALSKTSGSKTRVKSVLGQKQKLWAASSFRLSIDKVPEFEFTNKIDSFTIKQGVKPLYTGEDRFPQIEPTKIDFPHLTGTLALEYCEALHEWHNQTNILGTADPKAQKHGSLEFLDAAKKPIFKLELYQVGLYKFSINQSTAGSDQIKRAKFDLYVGKMDLDGGGALGLE